MWPTVLSPGSQSSVLMSGFPHTTELSQVFILRIRGPGQEQGTNGCLLSKWMNDSTASVSPLGGEHSHPELQLLSSPCLWRNKLGPGELRSLCQGPTSHSLVTKTGFRLSSAKSTVYVFGSNDHLYLWQKPRVNLKKNSKVQKESREVVVSSFGADKISLFYRWPRVTDAEVFTWLVNSETQMLFCLCHSQLCVFIFFIRSTFTKCLSWTMYWGCTDEKVWLPVSKSSLVSQEMGIQASNYNKACRGP